jgi:hypothetical protein
VRRALALAVLLLLAAPAAASERPTGWNGENPFRCTLQNAGFEPTGPDPGADPYCVDFDKRHQNVSEGGVVQFLSLEPGRVAAASPKCFYFQSDHWRGSVVQDDGSTKTYEWDGHYFFDKARGEGGAWVTNFNVNGQSGDPSQVPGMPPDFAEHFGQGTGGVTTHDQVDADPTCVARARKEGDRIYAAGSAGGAGAAPGSRPRCVGRGAVTSRSLGPVALGDTERRVRDRLGAPDDVLRGTLRWCAAGRGRYVVAERGDRSGDLGADDDARVVLLLTTDRGFSLHGVRVGSRARALRRAFPRRRTVAHVGRTQVVAVRRRASVLVGLRKGRVRFLAVYDRRALRRPAGVRLLTSRSLAG